MVRCSPNYLSEDKIAKKAFSEIYLREGFFIARFFYFGRSIFKNIFI